MSIRYKIFSAFAVVALMACAVAFLGFKGISDTGHIVAELYNGPLIAVNYARAAQSELNEARLLFSSDLGEIASEDDVARFEKLLNDLDQNLSVVRQRVHEPHTLTALDRTDEALRTWLDAERSTLYPPSAGLTAVPTRHAMERLGTDAVSALDDLIETVAADGYNNSLDARHTVTATRDTMLTLALTVVLSGLILAAAFAHSISKPVLQAMGIAHRVASGNFEDSISCARRDEFGGLLRSLAVMQSRLKARVHEERLRAIASERLSRMLSALSAASEAIMRANSREQLFELVCDAVMEGGEFTSIATALVDHESEKLRILAARGLGAEAVKNLDLATWADKPEDQNLMGNAFRYGQPRVNNDYVTNEDLEELHGVFHDAGALSAAALPLLSRSRVVGVIGFLSTGCGYFTAEMLELLGRLATNVSLALEDFDRMEERERAEEEIRYLATHDGLTDLPNRTLFSELLTLSINSARRYGSKCAVLFVDLDRFKIINDSLGHDHGDALLIEIASRLRRGVRSSDVVARLGGDEFVLLLTEITEREQVAYIARSLLASLRESVNLAGQDCSVTASIGVAMFPDDGEEEALLMKNADMAMYLAKQEGKNDVRFYSNKIKAPPAERIKLESCLHHALERGEFFLEYQPKQSMVSETIVGVEALLRWQSPELGIVTPAQFIPVAEETGLIVPIGRWVLHAACAQNVAWQKAGLAPISVAVNVSPRQFTDEHLLEHIDMALEETGMDPSLLQIEITESMVMLNVEQSIALLDAIQSRGVRLAIDDFGTGYSSMSLMKRFPIDTIKIDRSFVRDLPIDGHDKAIIQAIIHMGKALGLTIVAEGVETLEQSSFLRHLACDEIQGYHFSKPVAPEVLAEICRQSMAETQRVAAIAS